MSESSQEIGKTPSVFIFCFDLPACLQYGYNHSTVSMHDFIYILFLVPWCLFLKVR